MNDESSEKKGFKVEDRRTASGVKEPAMAQNQAEDKSRGVEGAAKGDSGPVLKVDFSTFLLSLLSSALIQLGDLADPITGKVEKNLDAAGQTIDILDILRVKTEGNLTKEEDDLLRNATAELKWKYLDALKQKG